MGGTDPASLPGSQAFSLTPALLCLPSVPLMDPTAECHPLLVSGFVRSSLCNSLEWGLSAPPWRGDGGLLGGQGSLTGVAGRTWAPVTLCVGTDGLWMPFWPPHLLLTTVTLSSAGLEFGGQLLELQKVMCSLQPPSLYREDMLGSRSECTNLLTSLGRGLGRGLGWHGATDLSPDTGRSVLGSRFFFFNPW